MPTTPTIGRRFAAFLIVLVTAVGVSLFSVGSASAAPVATEAPVVVTDGCTLVDDDPVAGISFTPACDQHDICYALKTTSRSSCDAAFLKNTLDICWQQARWTSRYAPCISWAYTYYVGVRIFGIFYWNSSNPAARVLTPMQG
jgi:Prokaryotic phospholipase A2